MNQKTLERIYAPSVIHIDVEGCMASVLRKHGWKCFSPEQWRELRERINAKDCTGLFRLDGTYSDTKRLNEILDGTE